MNKKKIDEMLKERFNNLPPDAFAKLMERLSEPEGYQVLGEFMISNHFDKHHGKQNKGEEMVFFAGVPIVTALIMSMLLLSPAIFFVSILVLTIYLPFYMGFKVHSKHRGEKYDKN